MSLRATGREFLPSGRLLTGWSVVLCASIAIGSFGIASGAEIPLRSSLLAGLNGVRAQHGLGPLDIDRGLDEAATAHSDEMLLDGYFGHVSADGAPFWKRIQRFYPESRAGSWRVGENLLWIPGTTSADSIIRAWMASPDHRANILAPGWHEIGIGIGAEGDAPGVFGRRPVTVVTVDFGARSSS